MLAPLAFIDSPAAQLGCWPAAGLEIVDGLMKEPALKDYHLLPSVRGDFLAKLGNFPAARSAFERAASMTRNAREKELLLERAAACSHGFLVPGARGDSTPR